MTYSEKGFGKDPGTSAFLWCPQEIEIENVGKGERELGSKVPSIHRSRI